MKLQVLVATINQTNNSLIEEMNIKSDAIVINQCDYSKVETIIDNNKSVHFYSFNERGVGLSRNNALMRSTADICLFADDDVVYTDSYKTDIINSFKENPKADIIIFNVPSTNNDRPSPKINKKRRVRFYNCLKYGTFCIAVKNSSIKKSNIYFSTLFGGGAIYGSGEDSLFLLSALKNGLKIFTSPIVIGTVTHKESTWFSGYNDKYFYDKGAWINCAFPRMKYLVAVYFTVRFKNISKLCINKIFKLILSGIIGYNNLLTYDEFRKRGV